MEACDVDVKYTIPAKLSSSQSRRRTGTIQKADLEVHFRHQCKQHQPITSSTNECCRETAQSTLNLWQISVPPGMWEDQGAACAPGRAVAEGPAVLAGGRSKW